MLRRAATFATVILLGAAAAQPPRSPERDFKFSEADRKLLDHSLQLDQQLRGRGLVLRDLALEQYLSDLAVPLVSVTPAPEHVVWAFRVLGDASVNAFALPNGSIYVTTGLLAVLFE
jgi:predicted Zn-dependent protease